MRQEGRKFRDIFNLTLGKVGRKFQRKTTRCEIRELSAKFTLLK